MKTIRILQLSDIHWKKQRDAADDYTDIRDKMLQDLNYYCQETGNSFDVSGSAFIPCPLS